MRIFLLLFLITIYYLLSHQLTPPQHYFYDSIGILTVNGSVAGDSGPIIIDFKGQPENECADQYFIFSFCADRKRLQLQKELCDEGLTVCYDGQLGEEVALKEFQLDYHQNEVAKKCLKVFHGFQVSLLTGKYKKSDKEKRFFRIKTTFTSEPYYYEMPVDGCLDIWLGDKGGDLLTRVRNKKKQLLWPVQIYNQKTGKTDGIIYTGRKLPQIPDIANGGIFKNGTDLQMLYLDFKSKNYAAQKMFTVAPEMGICNLMLKVTSNKIGPCKSQFRQKSVALRAAPTGETKFSLTIETGTESENRKEESDVSQKIQDIFMMKNWERESEVYQKHGLQTETENIEVRNKNDVLKDETKPGAAKDQTPWWKKLTTHVANGIMAGACLVASFFLEFFGTCNGKVNWRDKEYDIFSQKITDTKIFRTTNLHTTSTAESMQTKLSEAFKHTVGSSKSRAEKNTQSESVTVQERTVFKWTINVPPGKVLTPLQMFFDCDGNSVPIPWMKFLMNDANDHRNDWVEDYDTENVDLDTNTGKEVAPEELLKEDDDGSDTSDQSNGGKVQSSGRANVEESWGVPQGIFDENDMGI